MSYVIFSKLQQQFIRGKHSYAQLTFTDDLNAAKTYSTLDGAEKSIRSLSKGYWEGGFNYRLDTFTVHEVEVRLIGVHPSEEKQ